MALTSATFTFLKQLEKNNNKEWFDKNRDRYKTAREDFDAFLHELLVGIAQFDDRVYPEKEYIHIFRINRDIRFSKNKSPYKNNFGAEVVINGKRDGRPGYYLHIQPGDYSGIAGGVYRPDNKVLTKIRQHIVDHEKEFLKIVNDKKLIAFFGEVDSDYTLKRMPRGFEDYEGTTIAPYLKLKSFTVWHPLLDGEIEAPSIHKTILKGIQIMRPFIDFIREAMKA